MNRINAFIDIVLVYRVVVLLVSFISVTVEPLHLIVKLLFNLLGHSGVFLVLRFFLTFVYFNLVEIAVVYRDITSIRNTGIYKFKLCLSLLIFGFTNVLYLYAGLTSIFSNYTLVLYISVAPHIYGEGFPALTRYGRSRRQSDDEFESRV